MRIFFPACITSLFFISQINYGVQPPVFAGVTVNCVVSVNADGGYDYKYSFANPSSNTVRVLNLTLDTTGVSDLTDASLRNDNLDWIAGLSRVRPEARWNLTDKSLSQTEPGTQVNGLHLRSFALPQIRNMYIRGDMSVYFRQWGLEKRIELHIPDNEEFVDTAATNLIRARYTLPFKALGPLGVPAGSYAHWDQIWNDIQAAPALGWLKDAALINTITTHFSAARDAARLLDGVTATQELHAVIDAIQAATPEQRTDEGFALIYYNALYLSNASLYPCEPILTLVPPTGDHHLGETHTVTATLTNQVDGLPIEANGLRISVIAGPHLGQQVDSFTDVNGQLSFTYRGPCWARILCRRLRR